MNWRRVTITDIGSILSFKINVDKNGCEVCDGEGRWIDTK